MVGFRVPLALGAAVLSLLAMTVATHAAAPAEMRVDAPSETQVVGTPFEARVSITRADAVWAGYGMQLIYDSKVLRVNSVKAGGIAGCDPATTWANNQTSPTIITGCVFQSTQATGVSEIIEFQCLKDGSSSLHLITSSEDTIQGTWLFDENAVTIATDLVDTTVTCGAGGPVETVAVPTNPPPPTMVTVAPGTTPGSGGETPGSSSSAAAGGTPGAGGTPASGTPGAPSTGGTAPAGPAATRQAATSAASASKTSTAQNATQASDDSGMPAWLIAVIVVVVLGAAGGAGWFVLKRRGASGG